MGCVRVGVMNEDDELEVFVDVNVECPYCKMIMCREFEFVRCCDPECKIYGDRYYRPMIKLERY